MISKSLGSMYAPPISAEEPLSGVQIVGAVADIFGNVRFEFDTNALTADEPLSGFAVSFNGVDFYDADIIWDFVLDSRYITLSAGLETTMTHWRYTPPSPMLSFSGGKELSEPQSGLTEPWT